MLLNLKDMRENPPSLSVSVAIELFDTQNVQLSSHKKDHVAGDTDDAADGIDWGITVDSAQIDWDIGTLVEADDSGNGLGPYEIVNASEIPENISSSETVKLDQTVSEISWDISVETSKIDIVDDANLHNIGLEEQTCVTDTLSPTLGTRGERSQLLETDYRNKILDDLYEVFAALSYCCVS